MAAGYRSIGDSITGDEHYVKWAYVDDGRILDPDSSRVDRLRKAQRQAEGRPPRCT